MAPRVDRSELQSRIRGRTDLSRLLDIGGKDGFNHCAKPFFDLYASLYNQPQGIRIPQAGYDYRRVDDVL